MTQAVVSIHVKEFEYSIQNIVRQLVTCGDLYSSFKLGWKLKNTCECFDIFRL